MEYPKFDDYPFEIRRLSADEGGGYLISWPDLPGCMSDGETPAEAIENGRDAFDAWMGVYIEEGREIPVPGGGASGKFIARLPKSLHARLVSRAKQEGVSMNALVASILAEDMGRHRAH
ncbi:type II toxin-antitoxin system HicB family antitoxin [Mangrovitalea sediminis]|uniref:type II toxin-antitoxin system HicB family antitoxin n=1 Tax=Mangrovitalea sediminis TaxID=1982043 RepID=UPI000BE4FB8C|nr:type II toxin-antitoxin system HicB family antitoxin [Mangrovitalea sediminis]